MKETGFHYAVIDATKLHEYNNKPPLINASIADLATAGFIVDPLYLGYHEFLVSHCPKYLNYMYTNTTPMVTQASMVWDNS
jgi:hypothetical protein